MEILPKTTKMHSHPSLRFQSLLILAVLALFCAAPLSAANSAPPPPPPPKPSAVPATPINGFQVPLNPANIAPTESMPTHAPEVVGQPKNETTHPNLIWDQEDIDHYKEMLKTSKELQIQFNVMKAKVDERIAQPVELPVPQQGADGQYPLYGDTLPPFPSIPTEDSMSRMRRWFGVDSDMISNIATIYVLTGDEKYGEYAKQLLLGWAHCYEWGPVKVIYRSGIGAQDALFVEGLKMNHFAFAYDLVYNLKSWTPEQHKQMHDDFFYPMADSALYPGGPDNDKDNSGGNFTSQINNRGMMSLESVYAAGIVTGDQQLIDAALYGVHTPLKQPDHAELGHFPPRQDWYAGTAADPGHGLLNCFFAEKAIPGGMWIEGTPSYAFYVLGPMINAAEIGWHHGTDFYRNNNGIFKSMFDFPILLSYPDLTVPGLNDSHRESLLTGAVPVLYEYAYRRYQDPRYLAMINAPEEKRFLAEIADPAAAAMVEDELLNPPPPPVPGTPPPPPLPPGTEKPPKNQRSLSLLTSKFGGNPPSFMYDLDPTAGAVVPPSPSVNYSLVGFGIIRTPSVSGKYPQGVILSYGPTASHGHPDKLAIDVFGLDDLLMPSPGVNFPYSGNIRIPKWYHTTLGHNVLTVDEKSQDYLGDNSHSTASADQTVFAPASTVGMQRAWTSSAYPGVTMDRAVFMTPNYLGDIYGAFSTAPHKYDLAWHIRGEATSDLAFAPLTFDPNVNGYNWFTSARASAATDKPWSVTSTRDGNVARLHVASGPATQPIIGEGGIWVDDMSKDPTHKPTCPTIIERRENQTSTIYGNALDFSNSKDGFVKDVTQFGSLDVGFGLLKLQTANGTDLCFAAYRPGSYNTEGLQTDAIQALVQMNGQDVQTLYLAGGKTLSAGGASITRSDVGLAYVEKTLSGNYIVGNPSPADATVTITLPALQGLAAFALDEKSQKGAVVTVTPVGGTVSLPLKAGARVLFTKS